jgi:hypothetical protein
MLKAAAAKSLITTWIEAGNRKDVEAIMSLYAGDPEFESPLVVEIAKEASGRLRGRAQLRQYFATTLARPYTSLHLIDVAAGVSSLCARYVNHQGTRSTVFMQLDAAGKITRHFIHYME